MCPSPQGSRRPYFLRFFLFAVLVALIQTSLASAQTSSQLVCSPCSLSFGNVAVGGSEALAVSFTNPGTTPITISSKDKSAPWFFYPRGLPLPYTLHAGQTVTFNMIFAPASDRSTTGTFTYHNSATNTDLVLSVSGTGVAAGTLSANPVSLGFGWVAIGTVSTKTVTVTNPSKSALTISQVSNSGGALASPFTTSGINTPITLSGGQSFTFQVTFTPKLMGDFFGNLSVVSSSGSQIMIAENGVGAPGGVLSVSPASLNFGNVTVGSSQNQTVTLSAVSAAVTVSSDSLGSSEYSVGNLTLPVTLSPGQSLPVTVTFAPQASGSANTNLAFTTGSGSASSSVQTALTGTGVAQVQHSVTVSWQPSSSSVSGYNVYRGAQSGGPYSRVNSSTDSSTAYADDSVQGGNSYYYEVTSVDANGMESVPSSPVEATIPN
jgi:hypothetical protein